MEADNSRLNDNRRLEVVGSLVTGQARYSLDSDVRLRNNSLEGYLELDHHSIAVVVAGTVHKVGGDQPSNECQATAEDHDDDGDEH